MTMPHLLQQPIEGFEVVSELLNASRFADLVGRDERLARVIERPPKVSPDVGVQIMPMQVCAERLFGGAQMVEDGRSVHGGLRW